MKVLQSGGTVRRLLKVAKGASECSHLKAVHTSDGVPEFIEDGDHPHLQPEVKKKNRRRVHFASDFEGRCIDLVSRIAPPLAVTKRRLPRLGTSTMTLSGIACGEDVVQLATMKEFRMRRRSKLNTRSRRDLKLPSKWNFPVSK